jgi:hypothetical protein
MYREGQKADDHLAKFYFSQPALYKRRRDLNNKNTLIIYNFSVFAILYFYCQYPWLRINFFLVKENHLALLPTAIETWCTGRFRPCQNAAKPQWPYQSVAFGSQQGSRIQVFCINEIIFLFFLNLKVI